MEQINKKDIVQPDWNFKNVDLEQYTNLKNSIRKNGQTKNIIVRLLDSGKYEIIDGKNVFKILKDLDKDFIWCHVYRNITELESMLLYLQHDFHFENNFVEVSKAIKKIHNKITKLEVSKFTQYTYNEVNELLSLAEYDFSKFDTQEKKQQSDLF